jgi:predicted  nucleic acid-binding Zn-ribbon protein
MNEIQLLIIGALIGLVSGIILQSVTHIFSSQRDKANWQREEIRRNKERFEQEKEKLESEKSKLESKITKLQESNLDYLTYGITLLNQRRDALLGFNQDEQNSRADAMREILSRLNIDELEEIAKEKKPLPELPGKPKSLSSLKIS